MQNSINGMAERFRKMLQEPGAIELPGCYDTLSAMVLEQVGFKSCFLSGYGVAASMLGNPDIGLTTLFETILAVRNVTQAIKIPLVVDVDNGYGNEDNVARTVCELEHAGAAAMIMEDQIMPKRCGHSANKKILPLDLYLRKLKSALGARQTPMIVIARTDSTDIDDAIERTKAFHDLGADVCLIDGLESLEVAEKVAKNVPGLKQINLIYGGKSPILPAKKLQELGFKVLLYSTPALYVSMQAMLHSMKQLRETSDLNVISKQSITFKEFQTFIEGHYFERPYTANLDHEL
jgi:2-methylisocitrate lyase-like PEP mutase family enzyme